MDRHALLLADLRKILDACSRGTSTMEEFIEFEIGYADEPWVEEAVACEMSSLARAADEFLYFRNGEAEFRDLAREALDRIADEPAQSSTQPSSLAAAD